MSKKPVLLAPVSNTGSTELRVSKTPVLLAQFANGNLRSFGKSKLKFTLFKKPAKECNRILVASSNRLSYIGSNHETYTSKITSSVLKICVINKHSSTVKLYETEFFQLKPKMKRPEIVDVKSDKTFIEKSSDLTLAFGSKTQIKKVNTNKKYASTLENSDSVDNLSNTISEASLEQKKVSENNASSAIPPQNSSASNVDEVYNLQQNNMDSDYSNKAVISKEEFDVLDTEAQVFLQAKQDTIQLWRKEYKYPDLIIRYLENNIMCMSADKAKLLCYLNYMFSFLKTTYKDWKRKDPVPSVPEPFKQKLIDSFTMNKSLPMKLKDKLLAYAMVLTLKLNNYIINCNDLASSTKIPVTRLTAVAHALGCHVSESRKDGIKIIQLKLPLYKMTALPKRKKM